MARLRNRQDHIPGGFKFYQPETNWRPPPWSSFETLVQLVFEHRRANPVLAQKHGWALRHDAIEDEVDTFNAQICLDHGWNKYVQAGGGPSPPLPIPRSLGSGVAQLVAGGKTLIAWLGEGGHHVAPHLANSRAQICATCPQNKTGDWSSWFTRRASEIIRAQLSIRSNMNLTTPDDEKLNVCDACGCPLKLKVHVPIEHIRGNMEPDAPKKLDPRCWILKEP